MIVPIGAGSEAAAAITVLKQIRPEIEIIAVQAEASQAAFMSWKAGENHHRPQHHLCRRCGYRHGLRRYPFRSIKTPWRTLCCSTETELYEGIALAAHHTRNLTEGAGSACLRAAFKIRNRLLAGKKVAIQMSGGNASGKELQKAMDFPCLLDGSC